MVTSFQSLVLHNSEFPWVPWSPTPSAQRTKVELRDGRWLAEPVKGWRKRPHFKICSKSPNIFKQEQWAFCISTRTSLWTLFSSLWNFFLVFSARFLPGDLFIQSIQRASAYSSLASRAGWPPGWRQLQGKAQFCLFYNILRCPFPVFPGNKSALWEMYHVFENTSSKSRMFSWEKRLNPANP